MLKSITFKSGKVALVILVSVFAGFLVVGATAAVAVLGWKRLVSNLSPEGLALPDDAAGQEGSASAPGSGSTSSPASGSAPARRPVVASAPIHANAASYRRWMARDDVLVMVDYYADWCPPCRAISPLLSQLAARHGDKVVVLKVNIDREKQLARQAGVRPIPDVRLFHRGSQLEKVVGGYPYSHYEQMVLNHQSKLPAPRTAARSATGGGNSGGGTIKPIGKDWTPPGVKRTR